jgi:hypothetical protein
MRTSFNPRAITVWIILTAVLPLCGGAPALAGPQAPGQPPTPVAPAPQEDVTSRTDQAPGSTSIPVTLTNDFISQRLPFDIPFYVSGTVPTSVNSVSLRVYRVETSDVATELIAALNNFTCTPVERTDKPVSSAAARPGAAGAFNILVSPLDPDYYYVFCFISVAPVPLTEIETPVRGVFADAIFALVGQSPEDVSLPLAQAIHRRLSEEIDKIGARRGVQAQIPAGNIFHRDTQIVRGTPAYNKYIPILIPLINGFRNVSAGGVAAELYVESQTALRNARNGAVGGPAKEFLTETLLATFPADVPLPSPRLAITSKDALNLGAYPFNVEAALSGLRTAIDQASEKKNEAAATALRGLIEPVRSLNEAAGLFARSYEAFQSATQTAIENVLLESRSVSVNFASTVLGADLTRSSYVSLDAGIAYPWRLASMVFYAGTNIYFRPINKEAPLRYKGTFLHRFALTIGITTTVKDDSRRAIDLRPTDQDKSTSNSLLIGGGFRVTPSIRLGAGALVFKESDPNPLIKQTSVTATPYLSLAVDVDVAKALKSFFP